MTHTVRTVDTAEWSDGEREGIDWANPFVVTSSPYGETLTHKFPTVEAAQEHAATMAALTGTYMTSWGEEHVNTEATIVHYINSTPAYTPPIIRELKRPTAARYEVRSLDTLEVLGTGLTRDEADDIIYSAHGGYSLINLTHLATYGPRGAESLIYYSAPLAALTGDQPMSAFPSDDAAYEYAERNGACVYEDDTNREIYCFRADH